jgi:hypothetical protein
MRTFLTQTVPSYAFAFLPAVLVRMGWAWMAWTALAVGMALILISIFYYSPTVLPQRRRAREDKVYTGLLFVAVALLASDPPPRPDVGPLVRGRRAARRAAIVPSGGPLNVPGRPGPG